MSTEVTQRSMPQWPVHITATPCWHDKATKTVGPTTDQINWWCPACGATRTTWPNDPVGIPGPTVLPVTVGVREGGGDGR